MRITEEGGISIPEPLRKRFGFLPNTEVEWVEGKEGLQLRKTVSPATPAREEPLATHRRMELDRIRAGVDRMTGTATRSLTTEEIMRMTRAED